MHVNLTLQGDKALVRKLDRMSNSRTRHLIMRKAVRAGARPILLDARRRVPQDLGDARAYWFGKRTGERSERGRRKIEWTQRVAKKGLSALLRRMLDIRIKAYPGRGIVWGGVGVRTRIKVQPPGAKRPMALSTIAWNVEHGIGDIAPRPFVRPAFKAQWRAAVAAMAKKAWAELKKAAQVK